jgi:hypothetical protein
MSSVGASAVDSATFPPFSEGVRKSQGVLYTESDP